MRCPDCTKFVSLDFADPEVEDLSIEGDEVKCTVRLVMNCAECSTEMKEYSSEMSELLGPKLTEAKEYDEHFDATGAGKTEECELEVVENGCEQVEKEEGKGKKKRTLFGAEVHYEVRCACGKAKAPYFYEGNLESDMVSPSEMDECC